MTSVLRLGIYRERIEKYRSASNQKPAPVPTSDSSSCSHRLSPSVMSPTTDPSSSCSPTSGCSPTAPQPNRRKKDEDLITITIERQTGKQLGIRLSGGDTEPSAGIFVADIQDGSTTKHDGRLQKMDRILFINGRDVRNAKLSQASALIQVGYFSNSLLYVNVPYDAT